jgi:hypothetical protein
MIRTGDSGQAMVEFAIGVALFLLVTLGAVQVGLLALAEEGVQSASLAAARAASVSPQGLSPAVPLESGAAAAETSLKALVAGMARPALCPEGGTACWATLECVRYQSGLAQPGTARPCASLPESAVASGVYGPIPEDLDGAQNPRCRTAQCFGVAAPMRPCRQTTTSGRLEICLAYTSWPPRAVDVWITGELRTIIPWIGSAGPGSVPVSSRLRLSVETFS